MAKTLYRPQTQFLPTTMTFFFVFLVVGWGYVTIQDMQRYDEIRQAEEAFRQQPDYFFSDEDLDTAVKHVVLKESFIHANEGKRNKIWEDSRRDKYFVLISRFYKYDRFVMITIKNWSLKWNLFEQEILRKAENLQWNIESLQKALTKIKPAPEDSLALLPFGVYLTKAVDRDVWVIYCKWEYTTMKINDGDKNYYGGLSHTRAWAISADTFETLGFATCR